MVVSNEPGYYKAGHYGIRIENLQATIELPALSGERKMLGFETLTLIPIDMKLVVSALMTPPEWDWLLAYHNRIYSALCPLVSQDVAAWLASSTTDKGKK
jgi:Xaa-Pro aminopeptidase